MLFNFALFFINSLYRNSYSILIFCNPVSTAFAHSGFGKVAEHDCDLTLACVIFILFIYLFSSR